MKFSLIEGIIEIKKNIFQIITEYFGRKLLTKHVIDNLIFNKKT